MERECSFSGMSMSESWTVSFRIRDTPIELDIQDIKKGAHVLSLLKMTRLAPFDCKSQKLSSFGQQLHNRFSTAELGL